MIGGLLFGVEVTMGTVIVGLLLAGAVALAVKSMVHDKKKGKSLQCGMDCSRCGGRCH